MSSNRDLLTTTFSFSLSASLRTSLRISAIAASLCFGLSGAAMAQTTPMAQQDSPRAERMQKKHAMMADQHAQAYSELKIKLKLESAQEPAWIAFTLSMQAPATKMVHPDRATFTALTTPKRIDQMQVRRAAHDNEMQKRANATKAFYAALQPAQKTVFDSETFHTMHTLHGMGYKMRDKMGRKDSHHSHH